MKNSASLMGTGVFLFHYLQIHFFQLGESIMDQPILFLLPPKLFLTNPQASH